VSHAKHSKAPIVRGVHRSRDYVGIVRQFRTRASNETKLCFLTVYPPQTFVDNTPIPAGATMELKVYRSYDGGRTYGTQGVRIVRQQLVSFHDPDTGQARFDPGRTDWVECVVETPVAGPNAVNLLGVPVGNESPQETTVHLAASIVVNGLESDATNRYLTFRYAVSGIPGLVRYETPDTGGDAVPTNLSYAPAVVLPDRRGVWEGAYRLTAITLAPALINSPELRQQPGCQEALTQLEGAKDLETPMTLRITSITPESMMAPHGRSIYTGTAELHLASANRPEERQMMKADLVYHQDRSLVIVTAVTPEGTLEIVGDLLENATEYQIEGPMRMKVAHEGQEVLVVHGMWNVRRIK
jgi:hypothetical protein